MEGTITWLDIKDAPRDGTTIRILHKSPIFPKENRVKEVEYWEGGGFFNTGWKVKGEFWIIPDKWIIGFTHINPPEAQND